MDSPAGDILNGGENEAFHQISGCEADLKAEATEICPECKKGHMIPLNPEYPASKNHCFVCDNCGSMRMITPIFTIE